jgi:hypothetical protein
LKDDQYKKVRVVVEDVGRMLNGLMASIERQAKELPRDEI